MVQQILLAHLNPVYLNQSAFHHSVGCWLLDDAHQSLVKSTEESGDKKTIETPEGLQYAQNHWCTHPSGVLVAVGRGYV